MPRVKDFFMYDIMPRGLSELRNCVTLMRDLPSLCFSNLKAPMMGCSLLTLMALEIASVLSARLMVMRERRSRVLSGFIWKNTTCSLHSSPPNWPELEGVEV